MSTFVAQSAREQKKAGRRNAQQQKIQQREQQDAEYFWQCVRNEERSKASGSGLTARPSQSELFAKQGSSGINFQQYDAIPVSRSGPDSSAIPQVENFIDLRTKLPAFLSANLTNADRMNYTNPTPIQRHCVPLSLSGKYDVMACAQTGSGKTVAFLVPLIAHIADRPVGGRQPAVAGRGSTERATPAVPGAVIVAPTRELATQIELEAHKLTFSSDLSVVCVYGGAPTRGQLAMLARGVDILVATPGRLNDFLQRGLINLAQTKFFVLDEADRMLDMGFEPQIRQICERYSLPPPHARRTLMFSATFPDEVQRIAQKYMRTYVFVAVGRVGSTIDSITQRIIQSPANDKRTKLTILLPLLNLEEKTLVFCQKKHVASWLRGQISKELSGSRVDAIHGDRSQAQRESALEKFRDGKIDILVATDVAARGLDVPGITHVIQFDLPVSKDDFDSYVHRIGRTGRAGRLGVATSFFVPGMDAKSGQNGGLWEPLHQLLVENNQEVPDWFENLGARKPPGAAQVKSGSQPVARGKQPQGDRRREFDPVVSAVVTSSATATTAASARSSMKQPRQNNEMNRDRKPPGSSESSRLGKCKPDSDQKQPLSRVVTVVGDAPAPVSRKSTKKDNSALRENRASTTPTTAHSGNSKHENRGPKQPKPDRFDTSDNRRSEVVMVIGSTEQPPRPGAGNPGKRKRGNHAEAAPVSKK